jgi:hypothetical protein
MMMLRSAQKKLLYPGSRLAAPLDWWRTQERDAELTEMSTDEFRAFERSILRKSDINITVYSFIVITFQPRGSSLAARDELLLRRRRSGADDAGCSSSSDWAASTTAPLILRDEDDDASFCSEEAFIADFSAIVKTILVHFSGSARLIWACSCLKLPIMRAQNSL